MKNYTGIGHKEVSVPLDVYNILTRMDKETGVIDQNDLDVLSNAENMNVELINTETIGGKQIKIYGISSNDDLENFEIVKVR